MAAGPRDLLKEDPRIDWTVDNVLGVRNWGEKVEQEDSAISANDDHSDEPASQDNCIRTGGQCVREILRTQHPPGRLMPKITPG